MRERVRLITLRCSLCKTCKRAKRIRRAQGRMVGKCPTWSRSAAVALPSIQRWATWFEPSGAGCAGLWLGCERRPAHVSSGRGDPSPTHRKGNLPHDTRRTSNVGISCARNSGRWVGILGAKNPAEKWPECVFRNYWFERVIRLYLFWGVIRK